MCVMSMAYDHWSKYPWPWVRPSTPIQPWTDSPIYPSQPPVSPLSGYDLEKMKKLTKAIEDFHKTIEAAKIVDILTGQPDCTDPEKAKLEERVAELERQIAEFKRGRRTKVKQPTKPRKKAAK